MACHPYNQMKANCAVFFKGCPDELCSPTRIYLNLSPQLKSPEHSCPRPILFLSPFCIPYRLNCCIHLLRQLTDRADKSASTFKTLYHPVNTFANYEKLQEG